MDFYYRNITLCLLWNFRLYFSQSSKKIPHVPSPQLEGLDWDAGPCQWCHIQILMLLNNSCWPPRKTFSPPGAPFHLCLKSSVWLFVGVMDSCQEFVLTVCWFSVDSLKQNRIMGLAKCRWCGPLPYTTAGGVSWKWGSDHIPCHISTSRLVNLKFHSSFPASMPFDFFKYIDHPVTTFSK